MKSLGKHTSNIVPPTQIANISDLCDNRSIVSRFSHKEEKKGEKRGMYLKDTSNCRRQFLDHTQTDRCR